ncbi:MAG TPA: response regulator, partial [Actinomycetota bacterium]|nr:response regulator [Actinomycetota bacterium]
MKDLRVLLVDDYSSIRTLLRVVLEDEGYRTSEASNATEAIEAVLKTKPDLIILDLMMPQIDGRYVIEHLRQSGNKTPIIVLTAKTEGLDA